MSGVCWSLMLICTGDCRRCFESEVVDVVVIIISFLQLFERALRVLELRYHCFVDVH